MQTNGVTYFTQLSLMKKSFIQTNAAAYYTTPSVINKFLVDEHCCLFNYNISDEINALAYFTQTSIVKNICKNAVAYHMDPQ